MTQTELLITNFEEARRRSLVLWKGLPEDKYFWKPDPDAMHALEMIRHVVGTEDWFHHILTNNGDTSTFDNRIWDDGRPYTNLEDEIEYNKPFREKFLNLVRSYTNDDLTNIKVTYGKRVPRKLGDFLLRCVYHEGVHAGNFIAYLRAMGADRPWIWD